MHSYGGALIHQEPFANRKQAKSLSALSSRPVLLLKVFDALEHVHDIGVFNISPSQQ